MRVGWLSSHQFETNMPLWLNETERGTGKEITGEQILLNILIGK